MADKPLTTTEIKNKKRTQSKISQATGALGLTSLGAFGASKLPGSRVMTKTPMLRRLAVSRPVSAINPKKAENIALGTSTAGAGLGGIGSFNFAQYTRAEADKGKKVKKNDDPSPFEDGFYGTTTDRTEEVSKSALKTAAKLGGVGAAVGAAGGAAGGYAQGRTSRLNRKQSKKMGKVSGAAAGGVTGLFIGGPIAGATGAVAGGAAGGHYARKGAVRRIDIGKTEVKKSAFGVSHD